MDLTIRLATLKDIPTLNQLYADMVGEPPLSPQELEQLFESIARLPNYYIYIALQDGIPVGTFSLLLVPTIHYRGFHKFALLDAVTVAQSYRGRGIGAAMIHEALSISEAEGCYKITLSCQLQQEQSNAFYQALGFQQQSWSMSLLDRANSIEQTC